MRHARSGVCSRPEGSGCGAHRSLHAAGRPAQHLRVTNHCWSITTKSVSAWVHFTVLMMEHGPGNMAWHSPASCASLTGCPASAASTLHCSCCSTAPPSLASANSSAAAAAAGSSPAAPSGASGAPSASAAAGASLSCSSSFHSASSCAGAPRRFKPQRAPVCAEKPSCTA